MKFRLLITLLLLITYGCNNEDDSNGDEKMLLWNQTKCSDPWNTGANDSNEETEIAVIAYLESRKVTVLNLAFDTNSPLDTACEACTCGTGQRIIVDVKNLDVSKMEELGFYQ